MADRFAIVTGPQSVVESLIGRSGDETEPGFVRVLAPFGPLIVLVESRQE
jgi:hypothetical protein